MRRAVPYNVALHKEAKMPELSIIIVNHNTCEKLRDCLDSLEKHRHEVDFEIIVVDNASHDGSVEMLKATPNIHLIALEQNTWFSGGNNHGLAAANGRYICYLNPDTLVQDKALAIMLNYLKSHPEVSAVTCRQEHPDGDLLKTCAKSRQYIDLLLDDTLLGNFFWAWREKRRQSNWYADWQRDSLREVEVAPGSCIMAESSLLRSFGAFDERFKLYFTDDDLCFDLRKGGRAIHFLPDAQILHYEKSSVANRSRFARQIYFEDMLAYSHKHFGLIPSLFLRFWVILTSLAMDTKQLLKARRA